MRRFIYYLAAAILVITAIVNGYGKEIATGILIVYFLLMAEHDSIKKE